MKEIRAARRFPRWLLPLGAALCTLLIWGQSLLPAAQSSGESRALLPFLEPLLLALGVPAALCHSVLRKLAHFCEFGLLGLLWGGARLRGQPRLLGDRLWAAGGLCLLTALIDETIQLHVPGRSGMLQDVWVDAAGAAAGLLLAALLLGLGRRARAARGQTGP